MNIALYECGSCGETCSRQNDGGGFPDIDCACGATLTWSRIRYNVAPAERPKDAPYAFVKGRPLQWSDHKGVPNIARHIRSDQQQYELHARKVAEAKAKTAERRNKTRRKSDDEWQHIGKVPLEAHENMVEQTGQKDWWSQDTEDKLKRSGFWIGE